MNADMDANTARAWVRAITDAMDENAGQLTQLDAAIGDADHGTNMQRGFSAATAALDDAQCVTVGDVLATTGTTLVSSVGGASGPLYGSAFRAAGRRLTDATATAEELLAALAAGLEAIQKLGAAQPGDKTMVDAYRCALDAFDEALRGGADLRGAALAAADSAERGMRATIPMVARKGRASYLGPRSQGHQDPGATSTAMIFRALFEVVAGDR